MCSSQYISCEFASPTLTGERDDRGLRCDACIHSEWCYRGHCSWVIDNDASHLRGRRCRLWLGWEGKRVEGRMHVCLFVSSPFVYLSIYILYTYIYTVQTIGVFYRRKRRVVGTSLQVLSVWSTLTHNSASFHTFSRSASGCYSSVLRLVKPFSK